MVAWADRLSLLGEVTPFDYPYMAAGKKRPDRHPTLLAAHLDALDALGGTDDIVLIGKSMGGRIGCHAALERPVRAVICMGYPLVSGSGKVRDAVLLSQVVPVLFVQGTRDKMAPLDQLDAVRAQMNVVTRVHVVETGDHSLQITKTHTKKTGVTQDHTDQATFEAITDFLGSLPSA
jgi:predicted alpha/beta-hydrolase family hydrolase